MTLQNNSGGWSDVVNNPYHIEFPTATSMVIRFENQLSTIGGYRVKIMDGGVFDDQGNPYLGGITEKDGLNISIVDDTGILGLSEVSGDDLLIGIGADSESIF